MKINMPKHKSQNLIPMQQPQNEVRPSHEFNISPGLTSILLIFAILCLVSFAVLTYLSANSDRKLNDKVISRTNEYYIACNKAQTIISQIDEELLEQYLNSSDSDEYYAAVGSYRSFIVELNESQNLYITINIHYPTGETDNFYSIGEWYVGSISHEAIIITD